MTIVALEVIDRYFNLLSQVLEEFLDFEFCDDLS